MQRNSENTTWEADLVDEIVKFTQPRKEFDDSLQNRSDGWLVLQAYAVIHQCMSEAMAFDAKSLSERESAWYVSLEQAHDNLFEFIKRRLNL